MLKTIDTKALQAVNTVLDTAPEYALLFVDTDLRAKLMDDLQEKLAQGYALSETMIFEAIWRIVAQNGGSNPSSTWHG